MEATVWRGLSWCPPTCVTGPQDTFLLCSGKEAPGQGGHHKRKHGSLPPSCLQQTWGSQGPKYRLSPRASLAVVVHKANSLEANPQGCRGHLPLSQQPPCHFVSAGRQPGDESLSLRCVPFTRRADEGAGLLGPHRSSTCPSRGVMALTWKGEMWGSRGHVENPWVPWMEHLMAQGGLL